MKSSANRIKRKCSLNSMESLQAWSAETPGTTQPLKVQSASSQPSERGKELLMLLLEPLFSLATPSATFLFSFHI